MTGSYQSPAWKPVALVITLSINPTVRPFTNLFPDDKSRFN